jgi:hypothetical protein
MSARPLRAGPLTRKCCAFPTSPVNGRGDGRLTSPACGRGRQPQSGGRVRGRHKRSSYFNRIKYFLKTIFPFQNSFLYWPDELGPTHPSCIPRHRGGALACAEGAVRRSKAKNFFRTDEQFYCRSSPRTESRQPQRRRRAAGQPQRAEARHALGRASRPSRESAHDDPLCERALRAGEGAAQSASGAAT